MDISPIRKRKKELASDSYTPNGILWDLAKESDWGIRRAVAENLRASSDILYALSLDTSPEVRVAVAENSNTSKDILRYLAKDYYIWVKVAVSSNLNTPDDVLGELALDTSWSVRRRVAMNPKSSIKLLVRLFTYEKSLKEPTSPVIIALYENENLPYIVKKIIETLFRDMLP